MPYYTDKCYRHILESRTGRPVACPAGHYHRPGAGAARRTPGVGGHPDRIDDTAGGPTGTADRE